MSITIDELKKNDRHMPVIEIIEDEATLRDALHDRLTLEGFGVIKANDGDEGLALALSERPDMILLDIVMPKMDGLSMIQKLRTENEWGRNVPVILLTNLSPDDDKINKAIADYSPAYYLVKSESTIDVVTEKIKERLSYH